MRSADHGDRSECARLAPAGPSGSEGRADLQARHAIAVPSRKEPPRTDATGYARFNLFCV